MYKGINTTYKFYTILLLQFCLKKKEENLVNLLDYLEEYKKGCENKIQF